MVQDTARTLKQFKGEKCKVGVKPLLSFSGAQFDSPTANAYTLAKSLFTDFFRGGETKELDVEGLQLLISFFAGEDGEDGTKAPIHMRCWRIVTKRSGQKVPRVEVEEMGPRIDFKVGRIREADGGVWKEALKKAKGTEVRLLWPLISQSCVLTIASDRRKRRRMLKQISWEIRLEGYILVGRT